VADPNSQNQLWSKWTFIVHDTGRLRSHAEVELNAARWLKKGFGTAGRAKVTRTLDGWKFEALVETGQGRPSYDPAYLASVKRGFARFVEQGFGTLAWGETRVRVLAGDMQNGNPRPQMIEMPTLNLREVLGEEWGWRSGAQYKPSAH
jgi:hypothetical protein